MNQTSRKNPLNAAGRFYIDMDECLACRACVDESPNLIGYDSSTGTSYVFKQPENVAELIDMENAAAVCCVEAFRDNG